MIDGIMWISLRSLVAADCTDRDRAAALFVSRSGDKLAAALMHFNYPRGTIGLDVGCSNGGSPIVFAARSHPHLCHRRGVLWTV